MEQKKTLWIIAASGVFLLVVIGAALILNSAPNESPATASIQTIERANSAGFKPAQEIASPSPTTPALDSSSFAINNAEGAPSTGVGDSNVAQGNDATNILAKENPISQENTSEQNVTTQVAQNVTEIDLTSAVSSNVTPTSKAGAEAMSAVSAKKSSSTIYTAQKPTAKSNAVATTKSTKKTVPAPIKASPKYWVQAASFTNKNSADNARTTLDDNRIPAEVFTYKDSKDTLFYRVRVGPYTTKSEAQYWQNRICMIDLFKDTQSYVTETSSL